MIATRAHARDPVEVVDLADAVADPAERLRNEWNALARRCDRTSYFQTADWIWSWWETVAHRPATRVACWRADDGTLEAVAAVSRGRVMLHRRLGVSVPVKTLAGTGPGDADHCGAVASAHRRADVAQWLRAAAGRRTLVAEALAPEDGIAPRGARPVEQTPCPRLVLAGEDGPGPSPLYRRQLRKYAARIARAGVTFDWQGPGAVTPSTVSALFALHDERRRSRNETSTLGPDHRDLLLRCCARAGSDRGPVAAIARKGDDVIGVLFGFWWQRGVELYQKGWDPTYAPFSLGSLLVVEAIRASDAAHADTVDFLRGTEDYKYRFGAVAREDRTVVVPRGPVGALLVARGVALARRDARRARRTAA